MKKFERILRREERKFARKARNKGNKKPSNECSQISNNNAKVFINKNTGELSVEIDGFVISESNPAYKFSFVDGKIQIDKVE